MSAFKHSLKRITFNEFLNNKWAGGLILQSFDGFIKPGNPIDVQRSQYLSFAFKQIIFFPGLYRMYIKLFDGYFCMCEDMFSKINSALRTMSDFFDKTILLTQCRRCWNLRIQLTRASHALKIWYGTLISRVFREIQMTICYRLIHVCLINNMRKPYSLTNWLLKLYPKPQLHKRQTYLLPRAKGHMAIYIIWYQK